MGKRVVVIASGRTEQVALPHLVSFLQDDGISLCNVLIPKRNRQLSVSTVEGLVELAWYSEYPDKIVILVDTDGDSPEQALAPFRELPGRLRSDVTAAVLFAYAQQHLEAWYFADAANLREYLGRALGSVDTSTPDEIDDPKQHLRNILGDRVYTSQTSRRDRRGAGPTDHRPTQPQLQGVCGRGHERERPHVCRQRLKPTGTGAGCGLRPPTPLATARRPAVRR